MRTTALLVACLVPIAAAACSHTSSPQGATTSASPSVPSQPDATPPASPDKSLEPASAASSSAPPAPGDLALPPASAKVWNNAQSDGNVPTDDRGMKDYQAVIQSNRDKFRACYETSLGSHPDIRGSVTLSFRLAVDGKVLDAAIDPSASDITLPELEKCMASAVKSLSFPPSKRGKESVVRYPFDFKPGSKR